MIARGIALLAVTLAPTVAWAQQPAPQPQPQAQPVAAKLGGPGESCRARADCSEGLKCQNQTCTDEHEGQTCGATADCGQLRCIDHKCSTGASSSSSSGGGGGGGGDWMQFKFGEGVHPFGGIGLLGGPALVGLTILGTFNTAVRGAFLFALQGGVMIDRHQLSLEVSPFTYTPLFIDPTFQMNASYAYLIPLTEGSGYTVSWPLRIGAGLMTGNTNGLVYFQARADVLGVAVSVGHILIDISLPSFRWDVTASNGNTAHVFSWLFGFNTSYVF
jgi:hypothetical protein